MAAIAGRLSEPLGLGHAVDHPRAFAGLRGGFVGFGDQLAGRGFIGGGNQHANTL